MRSSIVSAIVPSEAIYRPRLGVWVYAHGVYHIASCDPVIGEGFMIWNIVWPLVVLTAVYGGIILGLVWLLRRAGVSGRWAIFAGFSVFGVGTGFLAAWAWPYDSCLLPNVWAVLAGDGLYNLSADHLGDLWILQVPRVYVFAATLMYTVAGLLLQWVYSRAGDRRA